MTTDQRERGLIAKFLSPRVSCMPEYTERIRLRAGIIINELIAKLVSNFDDVEGRREAPS